MEVISSLQKLGLSEIESTIYYTLLKYPDLTTVKLAKEIGINRRTIYDNLDLLVQKGLVTFKIINGTKYFNANDVKTLKQILDEKIFTLDEIFPQLMEMQKSHFEKTRVEILMGKQGVKTILEDAIECGSKVYWVGGGLHLIESFHFSRYLKDQFAKLNIKLMQPKVKQVKERLEFFNNIEVKFLPGNLVSSIGFIIYGNSLVIGQLRDEEVISIVIKSKEFADTFRNYFNLMWNTAKTK
ncbi:MAG: hypothetical protein KAK00_05890 [Nanoarchaeota archaeon]|nr:hypothetical protein [Nanoarchaeota archaeon]